MDAYRFDALTRSLSCGGSRRGVLAGALGGAVALLGLDAPETFGHNALKTCKGKKGDKRKKCIKKAKAHNRQHQSPSGADCQDDADCPDKTQACQGGRCQRICPSGACSGCNCLVHLEDGGDRSLVCAGSVETPALIQECRTDIDCPAEEPLCLLADVVSCTSEFCGICVISTNPCLCQTDADCPDQTQFCGAGECSPVCFGSFCSPCPLCVVHFETDVDRTPLCAESLGSNNGALACTTDADCPTQTPTCVRESREACIQPPCGQCSSVDICP